MKNFSKALDKEERAFQYLCIEFPKISDAKLKKDLVEPHIREVPHDAEFVSTLQVKELWAWKAFAQICDSLVETTELTKIHLLRKSS